MNCNELNQHPRDPYLHFDAATHTYRLADRELISVTTLVDGCFPQFDAIYWATRKAAAEGVDPQVILDRWEREAERARNLGTAMHEKIERYYLGHDCGDDTDAFRLFRLFAANNRLYPFRTEWRIYDEDSGVAGTLDFLERTPAGTFNIYDWKRSRKLVASDGRILMQSPYGKRGLHPLTHLHDTSYWHYAMQLSVYRNILERKYGIRVTGMKLGVFHPTCPTPWIVDVPYLHDEVERVLASRLSPCIR